MSISVKTAEPVQCKPYRLPFAKRAVVDNIVSELLENNILKPSISEYASPIVLVKKQNGADRMCIDYRALNHITEKQPFPMPVVEELLSMLAGNKFFSKFDLMAGYYQIPVSNA